MGARQEVSPSLLQRRGKNHAHRARTFTRSRSEPFTINKSLLAGRHHLRGSNVQPDQAANAYAEMDAEAMLKPGLGYEGGALVFGAGLAVLSAFHYCTRISPVFLFWAAFILTRPLGATIGDFLDKPTSDGALALSRPLASAAILALIIALIVVIPQKPGRHPGQPTQVG